MSGAVTTTLHVRMRFDRHLVPVLVLFLVINCNIENYSAFVSGSGTDLSSPSKNPPTTVTVIPKCCEFGLTLELFPSTVSDIGKERIKCVPSSSISNASLDFQDSLGPYLELGEEYDDGTGTGTGTGDGDMEDGNWNGSSWTIPSSISSSFSPIDVTFKVYQSNCGGQEEGQNEYEFELHWIHLNLLKNSNETEESVNNSYEDEISFPTTISPDGYFAPEAETPIYYPPTMYCMERVNSSSIAVQVCVRKKTVTVASKDVGDCSSRRSGRAACVPKCCPLGKKVSRERNGCVPTSQTWDIFPDQIQEDEDGREDEWKWKPLIILQSPATFCIGENEPPLSWTSDDPEQEFKLALNGDVHFKSSTSNRWHSVLEVREFYCLDELDTSQPDFYPYSNDPSDADQMTGNRTGSGTSTGTGTGTGTGTRVQILFFCGKSQDFNSIVFSSIYGGVMLGSSLFLFIAATINFLLWKKQNVHNWTVQAYIISLFFMYIFLGLSHILSQHYKTNDPTKGLSVEMCAFIGGGAHYFFVSTFCWLFMINFDLWWKFRKLTATSVQSQKARKRRFCLYVFFSTGVPAAIISAGICIQRFWNDGKVEEDWLLTPNYGKSVCYMEETAGWAYLYGPISALLIFNLAFFVSTIYSLYQIRKMTKIVTEGNHKNKEDQKYFRVKLFGKLFCIMGILWNFEVISFAVDSSKQGKSWSGWYWVFTDMLNIVQAIVIFYIFTCKRHVKTNLETQYPLFKTFFAWIRQAGEFLRMKTPKSSDPPTDSETAVASNTSNNERKRSSMSTSFTIAYAT